MDAASVERLFIRQGERVDARHVRDLDDAIARGRAHRGVGTFTRALPWGTITSYRGSGGVASAPVFRPEVRAKGASVEVRWGGPRGLIGGIAPTIGEGAEKREIFDDKKGPRPALTVTVQDFAGADECAVYFQVETDPQYNVQRVTPIAAPKLPTPQPYRAHKLALFLRLRGTSITYEEEKDRELFCSQGFLAVDRRSNGVFTALFWAQF